MDAGQRIEIFLITYNRKQYLRNTLDQLLGGTSPVRDFPITILDNASTDGTSEMLDEYCAAHPNLTHIRHRVNIGGNANICRAYEMGASSGKDYVWVLADDDKLDFTHWDMVEQAVSDGEDVICVSDYLFPDAESRRQAAYQIVQLTFVPAGIYKTSIITDSVLMAMYDAIYTMFSQSCLTIWAVNNRLSIKVCDSPIVFNGLHFKDRTADNSYTRGSSDRYILARRRDTTWLLGFSGVLSLLGDEQLRCEAMEAAINFKDICPSRNDLVRYMRQLKVVAPSYYLELLPLLPPDVASILRETTFGMRLQSLLQRIFTLTNEYKGTHKYKKLVVLGFEFRKEIQNQKV